MKINLFGLVAATALCGVAAPVFADNSFNGHGEYQTGQYGYYYVITGGQFPTGTTPNGDNGSGGTFRYLTDDPAWGRTTGVWHKDDWFPINAGIAVTLKNGNQIVYDNNGLEPGAATPADPDYYDYNHYKTVGKGAHVAYSMSNNSDWVYAGYMKLEQDTTITELIGYFAYSGDPNDALTGPFDPDNPSFAYRMNIWSNVGGNLLPVNTGSFTGDVFSTDNAIGSFSWSDTGIDRVGSTSTQNIYRMVYTLEAPITLQAGEYWFSHDATIVPAPGAALLVMLGVASVGWIKRRVA